MGLSQFDEKLPYNVVAVIDNSVNLSPVNIGATVPYPLHLDGLWVANSDTIDHDVQIDINPFDTSGGPVGSVIIAAGSGYGLIPPVELFSKLWPTQPFLNLSGNDALVVTALVQVVAPFELRFLARGGRV